MEASLLSCFSSLVLCVFEVPCQNDVVLGTEGVNGLASTVMSGGLTLVESAVVCSERISGMFLDVYVSVAELSKAANFVDSGIEDVNFESV